MNKKKIICLYGGPGTGKSTTAAGLFYHLKMLGYNCEMNREYIKDWVWENRIVRDGDQTYFFAKQSRKERTFMENNIEFIITDSPLILTHFYGLKNDKYEVKNNTSRVLLKHHHEICKELGYSVEHFMLVRDKEYNPSGRYQTKEEAMVFDVEIEQMLSEFGIKFNKIIADNSAVSNIIDILRS